MYIHEYVLPFIVISYIVAFVVFSKVNNKDSGLDERIDNLNRHHRI